MLWLEQSPIWRPTRGRPPRMRLWRPRWLLQRTARATSSLQLPPYPKPPWCPTPSTKSRACLKLSVAQRKKSWSWGNLIPFTKHYYILLEMSFNRKQIILNINSPLSENVFKFKQNSIINYVYIVKKHLIVNLHKNVILFLY